RIRPGASEAGPAAAEPLDEVRARCAGEFSAAAFYETVAANGGAYGPTFQGLTSIRRRDGEALATIEAPRGIGASAADYLLHPALLDACIQLIGAAIPGAAEGAEGDIYVPVELGRYRLYRAAAETFQCRVVVSGGGVSSATLKG